MGTRGGELERGWRGVGGGCGGCGGGWRGQRGICIGIPRGQSGMEGMGSRGGDGMGQKGMGMGWDEEGQRVPGQMG